MEMNARIAGARYAALTGLMLGMAGCVVACGDDNNSSATAAQGGGCGGKTLLDQVKDRGVLRVSAGTGPPGTAPCW